MTATHLRASSKVRCRIVLPGSAAQVNHCSGLDRFICLTDLNPDVISSIVISHLPHPIEAVSPAASIQSLFLSRSIHTSRLRSFCITPSRAHVQTS